jgi:hypothetical protein
MDPSEKEVEEADTLKICPDTAKTDATIANFNSLLIRFYVKCL